MHKDDEDFLERFEEAALQLEPYGLACMCVAHAALCLDRAGLDLAARQEALVNAALLLDPTVRLQVEEQLREAGEHRAADALLGVGESSDYR